MNKKDQYIKPAMQVLFGIGLFVVSYLMTEPIEIVEKYKGSNSYNPSDELFLCFVKWASLLSSIGLILIGLLGTVNVIKKK